MACWSRTPALPRTCPVPYSIDATLPETGVFQGCWHPRTAAPHPWSSASWPGVPWPFLPVPCGNVGSSGASHTRCRTAPSLSSYCHRHGTKQARQGPSLGLPLPIAILIIGGPKTTTDRLWGWSQASFHLLRHILLRVEARGEVPIPQVSWVRPGLEGYQLLPFQLLGPLGWIETSIGQPPNSTKLAKFSEVMIAHPCKECKLEGRVGWSHHLPVELQFLHWCLRKL